MDLPSCLKTLMIFHKVFIIFFFVGSTGSTSENRKPRLVHISIGNEETSSMIIMWSTVSRTGCRVFYDISDKLQFSIEGNVSKLLEDNWNARSYIHRAELTNLEANQTYFYQVSCEYGDEVFKSDIFMFKTLSNDKEQTVKLLVYGDMGSKSGKLTLSALQDELSTGQYQAIFHNGDFGYDLDSNGGSVGDEFLDMIQPIAAQFPYMTSPGNHELAHDLHHYRLRFSMPGTPWPMPFEKLWYSFDIGLVHFISFSSEVYFIHNQDFTCKQYDWLLEDLTIANQNREQTPWIIALGHRPMYCTNSNLDDCTPHFWGQWVKRGLEDLFYAMGVDLVIEAHEHSYERLWPVYHSDVIQHSYLHPRAPVHIISGAAGNSEGVDLTGFSSSWSAFRAGESSKNSYGRLSVVNKTHLHFDQISAITKDVLDQFWIVQENHGPFLQNVDCKNGTVLPEFCTCPLPIRFVTLLILFTSGIVIVIVLSIMFCCYSCRCCYFCLNNIRTCAHISGSWMNRRRQYRHQQLQQNTDIEDNFLVYQPTESIDSFDMFVH
ncbi:acid phosphatase type 7-like [Mytilus trossulus]|uniref:acid phosphatase type 7-like n=1 Tax=Mytilus trossulus TaxID=6551 RepID=UPI0030075D22